MDVIEYANEYSHGPVGFEYPFPTDAKSFPAWYSQFAGLESSDIQEIFKANWVTGEDRVDAISTCFSSYKARSLYYLPCEWSDNHHWLLFDNDEHVLFIPEPSKSWHAIDAPSELLHVIETFDGYQLGFKMPPEDNYLRCDAGFVSRSELTVIKESDEELFWEFDETVLGGVWFFSTPCGNRFYCRRDGSIAKWNHENTEIDDVFDSFAQFAEAFGQYYMSGDSDTSSPFCY